MSTRQVRPRRAVSTIELTIKQRTFISEYFADNSLNATKAAEKAGYGSPANAGSKLLANPVVQRAIGVELRRRLENNEVTAARVLKELSYIAFSDPIEMFDKGRGTLKQLNDMPEFMRRAIASIEVETKRTRKPRGKKNEFADFDGEDEEDNEETVIVKIKLWPKTNALELIAKHLGMLDERFKVEHGVDPASRAVLKSLLEKLEHAPSPVIDSNYIEHAATLPDNPMTTVNGKVINTLDGADNEAAE